MNKQNKSSADLIIHPRRVAAVSVAVVLSLVLLLTQGCASQATFDSADQAVDSAVAAIRAQDTGQLKKVLGAESDEIISSGDEVADQDRRKEFVKTYDAYAELGISVIMPRTRLCRVEWHDSLIIAKIPAGWSFRLGIIRVSFSCNSSTPREGEDTHDPLFLSGT